jgi:hypothetical protein
MASQGRRLREGPRINTWIIELLAQAEELHQRLRDLTKHCAGDRP